MRALALEHLETDPVGVFGEVLAERGIGVDRVMLHEGEPLPDWRAYDLVVAMGAGVSVWQEDEFPWITGEKRAVREAVLAGVPYFGVCFGVQLLADAFGADSFRGPEPEIGVNQVFLTAAARHDPVFRGFPADLEVCEWHSNHFTLPRGAVRLARSPRYENQAIRYGRVAYGIQCHLEPSLDDIRSWLELFPDSAVTFERQHGGGSVERLLEDYADFVPFLQQTARQVFARWLENALALGRLGGSARAAGARQRRNGAGPSGRLFGRDGELARIDAALASARRGDSAVLVLRGEAGIGKTALLDAAAARARGLRVLRASGEDAGGTEHPFDGLADLCRPLADRLERLSPQRAEAAAAILDPGSSARMRDRFAVYAGAFDLLVTTAAEMPLLVLVDDAHLLDDASWEAVAFIARRLGTDAIALLVATESEDDLSDAEDLRLGGLAPPDARALLDERSVVDLAPAVADRVVAAANGNPLALLEIPVDLTSEQRAGSAAIEESLPSSAEWAFVRRASALPAPARQALLVAALAGRRELEAIPQACRLLELGADALAAARASGLTHRDDGRVAFRHPLARMAVTYSSLRADRRAAHAALASALGGDAGSWHRARGAARADESIAAGLERLAIKAGDQAAFAAAARAFEFAARLTPDPDERARRLLEAGRTAHLAGNVNAALDHLDAALRSATADPLRRDAEHLRGRIIARSGSAGAARDRLLAVAESCERGHPALAAEMLADAVLPALRAGSPAEAVRIARRAARLAKNGGDHAELSAEIALGTALIFAGGYAEGAALVDAAAERAGRAADRQQRAHLGAGLVLAGRHGPARRMLTELIDEARAEGTVSVIPYALIRLANVELETGRWPAAAAGLNEARTLARETGQTADYGLALGALAWLDAARGHEEQCLAHVDEALELAGRLGSGSRLDRAATALGLLELGRGHPELAIPHLEEACRLQDEHGWSDAGGTPHHRPDLVEAYVFAGRREDALAALARFHRDAEQTRRPSALAAAARCRALLAEDGELDVPFAEALSRGGEAWGPFERARTALLYGTRLIDAGHAEDGCRVLAGALGRFEHLAAEPWAARARTGILAAGGALPVPRVPLTERLSPRELEVALAAAHGGSSLEIAERLFLGPHTVELQLASAAIKLGLESPAQLGEVVRRETGAPNV
jgi:GMP synthase-like glutamine amidotransferase/DNA-binding CsgD family transcriptional regulator/tetratricopeptide (TPR) repeat protein